MLLIKKSIDIVELTIWDGTNAEEIVSYMKKILKENSKISFSYNTSKRIGKSRLDIRVDFEIPRKTTTFYNLFENETCLIYSKISKNLYTLSSINSLFDKGYESLEDD